jgi:hypothetical protein
VDSAAATQSSTGEPGGMLRSRTARVRIDEAQSATSSALSRLTVSGAPLRATPLSVDE